MTRILGTVLTTAAMTLALTAVVFAQAQGPISGTIETVDCAANALVIVTPQGTELFSVASDAIVSVHGAPASFCGLAQYVGSPVVVTSGGANAPRAVGSVDVLSPAVYFSGLPAPVYFPGLP